MICTLEYLAQGSVEKEPAQVIAFRVSQHDGITNEVRWILYQRSLRSSYMGQDHSLSLSFKSFHQLVATFTIFDKWISITSRPYQTFALITSRRFIFY